MAVGTPQYPGAGGPNTYVKSMQATDNLVVSYSRNVNDFPLPRYIQYKDVSKDSGYYLKITAENAGRIVGGKLNEFVWPDGAMRPRGNAGTEKFAYADYRTTRYDYDFTLGYKTTQQADWNIRDTEAAFKSQQAMTGRTQKVHEVLSNTSNWNASHVANVTTMPGNSGSWELSTTQRQDIRRSLNKAFELIRKHTLSVVKESDLNLVFNAVTAQRIGESQEIVDYIKGSPEAWNQVKGREGKYAQYGLPDTIYGYPLVVEDTTVVTSPRDAATTTYADAMADGLAYLLARPGALTSKAGTGPSFSTVMLFLLEEMTVETLDDVNNRRTDGHVVDDFDAVITSDISGFHFTNVIE